MHLRYKASDERWDIDLRLEGFTEEQVAYWNTVLQKELALFLLVYGDMKRVVVKEKREE